MGGSYSCPKLSCLAQVGTSYDDCVTVCMDGLRADQGWFCEALCGDPKYRDSTLANYVGDTALA